MKKKTVKVIVHDKNKKLFRPLDRAENVRSAFNLTISSDPSTNTYESSIGLYRYGGHRYLSSRTLPITAGDQAEYLGKLTYLEASEYPALAPNTLPLTYSGKLQSFTFGYFGEEAIASEKLTITTAMPRAYKDIWVAEMQPVENGSESKIDDIHYTLHYKALDLELSTEIRDFVDKSASTLSNIYLRHNIIKLDLDIPVKTIQSVDKSSSTINTIHFSQRCVKHDFGGDEIIIE